MCTTIPNILRKLAIKYPSGFGTEDLTEAFIRDGYNPEKARRRVKQVLASGEVQNIDGTLLTIYSPIHYSVNPDYFAGVRVRPVKIERDGTVTYL